MEVVGGDCRWLQSWHWVWLGRGKASITKNVVCKIRFLALMVVEGVIVIDVVSLIIVVVASIVAQVVAFTVALVSETDWKERWSSKLLLSLSSWPDRPANRNCSSKHPNIFQSKHFTTTPPTPSVTSPTRPPVPRPFGLFLFILPIFSFLSLLPVVPPPHPLWRSYCLLDLQFWCWLWRRIDGNGQTVRRKMDGYCQTWGDW